MMTEVIEITRESYALLFFLLGLFVGCFIMPFFMWLGKQLKEALEK